MVMGGRDPYKNDLVKVFRENARDTAPDLCNSIPFPPCVAVGKQQRMRVRASGCVGVGCWRVSAIAEVTSERLETSSKRTNERHLQRGKKRTGN